MKNSNITEQLKLQKREFHSDEIKTKINQNNNRDNLPSINLTNKEASNGVFNTNINIVTKKEKHTTINPSFNQEDNQTCSSSISFFSSRINFPSKPEEQTSIPKKKKKIRRKL